MTIIETSRLQLRKLDNSDADFILKLLNQPAWIKYIGDKQVHSIADAETYILNGPVTMYEKFGYGLYLVALKSIDQPIGICGLVKRDYLDQPDLGFAFLSEFCRQGYAFEAAIAVIQYVYETFAITEIAAITTKDNLASVKLLYKLDFEFNRISQGQADAKALNLYSYCRSD